MVDVYKVPVKLLRALLLSLLAGIVLFPSMVRAQPQLEFNQVAAGFNDPLDVVNAGDGSNRLFIIERTGLIRIYNGSTVEATPFLNLSTTITDAGSEQGLLSLAFHPDYSSNRYFFVYYTRSGDGAVTIARYQTSVGDPNVADAGSGVVLLTIPKPSGRTNHNGGKLNFGADGYLYAGIGDGGGSGDPDDLAQDGSVYQGKMLRLDVSNFLTPPFYAVPGDNPFIGDAGVLDEIWAMGLRNPWRWSFDRSTNDMWIADVGQGAREEINFRPAGNTGGINYGWRCYEGTLNFNTTGCLPAGSYITPIFDYPHNGTTGGFSVTGGYVYRGTAYPTLDGYYIVADYISGNVWKIIPDGGGGWNVSMQSGLPGNIAGFGEDENGELYAVSLSAGILYNVQVNVALPVRLTDFYGVPDEGAVGLSWITGYELNAKQFDVEYSRNAIDFEKIGTVRALNSPNGNTYRFRHIVTNANKVYYRLKMIDDDNLFEYSKVISVVITGDAKNYIYPTIIKTGSVSLYLSETFQTIEVINMRGQVLLKEYINGRTGRIDIPLPATASGTCLVKVQGKDPQKTILQKIIIR